jgi:LacI family transcriptional regulator
MKPGIKKTKPRHAEIATNSTRPERTPDAGSPRTSAEVTIRDIARALDISHTTVSRALAGSPKISDETKLRVRAAVEQMGYVPSASARLMRGRQSSIVGLVIPDIQNDFYATVAKFVANAMADRSMQLMLCVTNDDPARELRELRALLELRPAGVIVVPSPAPESETLALLRNLCTVQLLRKHVGLNGTAVLIDDRKGVYSATCHLLDYGHRRIAYVGGRTEISTGRERLAGFHEALAERKIEAGPVMLGPPRPEFARHAVTSLMTAKNRPTGIIFGSSELTLGAMLALRALGLEWPRDVSVVGYHDPAWFELAERGITTVRLPVEGIALTATSLVLSKHDAHRPDEQSEPEPLSTDVQFTPNLVLRSSTAALLVPSR